MGPEWAGMLVSSTPWRSHTFKVPSLLTDTMCSSCPRTTVSEDSRSVREVGDRKANRGKSLAVLDCTRLEYEHHCLTLIHLAAWDPDLHVPCKPPLQTTHLTTHQQAKSLPAQLCTHSYFEQWNKFLFPLTCIKLDRFPSNHILSSLWV